MSTAEITSTAQVGIDETIDYITLILGNDHAGVDLTYPVFNSNHLFFDNLSSNYAHSS